MENENNQIDFDKFLPQILCVPDAYEEISKLNEQYIDKIHKYKELNNVQIYLKGSIEFDYYFEILSVLIGACFNEADNTFTRSEIHHISTWCYEKIKKYYRRWYNLFKNTHRLTLASMDEILNDRANHIDMSKENFIHVRLGMMFVLIIEGKLSDTIYTSDTPSAIIGQQINSLYRNIILQATRNKEVLDKFKQDYRQEINRLKGMLLPNIKERQYQLEKSTPDFSYSLIWHEIRGILYESEITPSELESILTYYIVGHEIEGTVYKDEFVNIYVQAAKVIWLLAKEYNKAKKFIKSHNSDDLIVQINELKNTINVNKANGIKQRELWKESVDREKGKVSDCKKEIERLRADNNKLIAKIEKMQNDSKEAAQLRKFVYELDTEDSPAKTEIDYAKELNAKNCIVFGGHDNWRTAMQKELPDWKFISVNQINFDTNMIKSADYLFIFTNYLSHSMYDKVIEAAEKYEVDYDYVNNTNVELCLRKMYESIQLQHAKIKR